MALRGQVVDLIRLHLLDDADQTAGIGHVAVVQDEMAILLVRILIEMIDAIGIKKRGTALDTMDLITFFQEKLGQISPILAGDAGNQCFFIHINSFSYFLFTRP